MTYQISRDGQTYGPYTLEDLQRYLASGNVLPTDLARGEDMTSWLPVAQILSAIASDAEPYVPPVSYPAPPVNAPVPPVNFSASAPVYAATAMQYPDPPNLNWGLELLLGFFTCGIFVVVWNLVISSWARRIEPTSKAFFYYLAATVLIVMNLGASWGVFIAIAHHNQQVHQGILGNLIAIATWVIRLIARFSLRETLERHYNGPEQLGLRLNPVLTFFFGGIYIQYKLNQVNEMKQALRYQNMAR
jgi:hypothetical protein